MKLYSYSYRDNNDRSCNFTNHDLYTSKTKAKRSMVALAKELRQNQVDADSEANVLMSALNKGEKIFIEVNGKVVEEIELEVYEVHGED